MKKENSKLPLKEKVSWGLGGFSEQLAVNGLNNLFIPIYNIRLGLDSVLIGWVMSIPRFFDMISDQTLETCPTTAAAGSAAAAPIYFGKAC